MFDVRNFPHGTGAFCQTIIGLVTYINFSSYSVIVGVRIVLKRTVVCE